MPAEEQRDVPSANGPRQSHVLHHDGLETQSSSLQRLERGVEHNVSHRGNRRSLPPDFLLPNTSTVDTAASRFNQFRENGHPLDEATIANRTAALRRLNGVAPRHRRAETTRARSNLSSQPTVVRTYSGGSTSRPPSDQTLSGAMYDRRSMRNDLDLPAAEVFSFENILQAIEHEAREDVDAIAEICGRSKMSLANEYDAHLPPQGELMASRQGGHASMTRSSLNQTLMPVEEASSIAERPSDSLQTVNHGADEIHQYNANSNQKVKPKGENIVTISTDRQTSVPGAGTPNPASVHLGSTTIPTRAQKKVLQQSTLPVLLTSDPASATQESPTVLHRAPDTLSKDEGALNAGRPATMKEVKESVAPHEDRTATGTAPQSHRRQSSLLDSLPPWLSWPSKPPPIAGHTLQSSGTSAVSSLRSILDKKGDHDRVDECSVHALP
ncbi:hypothetical protein MMC16_005048 [Acarospora aff. strigata]|nr:hypothetical protein [Acarospora aff. strigata]